MRVSGFRNLEQNDGCGVRYKVSVDLLKLCSQILKGSVGGRYESHDHFSIVVHTITLVLRLVIDSGWLGEVYEPLVRLLSSAFHTTSLNI